MAYKYQKGAATLSGSLTIEETLSVTGVSTLSALLSSSAAISGSAFYGSGANLTGITADSFEVDDTNADTEFKLVGVASTGTGVTLVAMNDGNFPAYNASTGKTTIKGALDVDGASTLNGNVTLGDAASDVTTVSGHLTASKGGTFSQNINIADTKDLVFAASGYLTFDGSATGNSGLKLADNLASAFDMKQGSNSYLKFVTTNSSEEVVIGKDLDCAAALNVDGALTANGTVTLGNAASDVTTVTGHLTASKGGLFSDDVQIATGKELKFVGNAAIDMSSATTGNAYISMADNLAEAFVIAQGANTYLTCVTSNSDEAVVVGKDLMIGDAVGEDIFLSLYSGIEYHGQELVTGNKTLTDVNRSHYICSGSGVITLTLPAAETGYSTFVKRHPSMSNNVKVAADGTDTIDGVTTDLVLETAGAAIQVVSSGSAWYVY